MGKLWIFALVNLMLTKRKTVETVQFERVVGEPQLNFLLAVRKGGRWEGLGGFGG